MIVLFDADSLVYSCAWGAESAEEAIAKFDEILMFILNDIAEVYDIEMVQLYHGSQDNFRYEIDENYKANRKKQERPEYWADVSAHLYSTHEALKAIGEEVDDYISNHWRKYTQDGFEVCIVSIDKDYLQLPALIYNYSINKRGFRKVSKEEAQYNFWHQMITGDAADNVNYLKGLGKVAAKKHLEGHSGPFSMFRRVYSLFIEKYGENARDKFEKQYKLLKIGL